MLVFFPGFLVGETPHISVRFTSCLFTYLRSGHYNSYTTTHILSRAHHILIIHRVWLTILQGWGYCDPAVRTQYVLLCQPVSTLRDRYMLLIVAVTRNTLSHIHYRTTLYHVDCPRMMLTFTHHTFHSPHIPLTTHSYSHVP